MKTSLRTYRNEERSECSQLCATYLMEISNLRVCVIVSLFCRISSQPRRKLPLKSWWTLQSSLLCVKKMMLVVSYSSWIAIYSLSMMH